MIPSQLPAYEMEPSGYEHFVSGPDSPPMGDFITVHVCDIDWSRADPAVLAAQPWLRALVEHSRAVEERLLMGRQRPHQRYRLAFVDTSVAGVLPEATAAARTAPPRDQPTRTAPAEEDDAIVPER